MTNSSILRITREISDLQKASELSLAVAFREDDVRDVRALIVGPPDTPYQFGFFEFRMKFPNTYPTEAPKVQCITTNKGKTRFNPNIYSSGKVCLSILGTWRGEEGENWSTAQGLESVLISIQSLMSANPYENEPGFEGTKITDTGATNYASKIQHEALRITVIERLEQLLQLNDKDPDFECEPDTKAPANLDILDSDDAEPWNPAADDKTDQLLFDPFSDLYKQRFLWYYDAYVDAIEKARQTVKDGKRFHLTQFEYSSNGMSGKYAYKSLLQRLQAIRQALDDEVESWTVKGLRAASEELGIAFNIRQQFGQHQAYYKKSSHPVELSLVHDNPFVWNLTFFGKPETDLYGATINVRINFSTDFPAEQPRVTVLTPLFHHRISRTGRILCYFNPKPESIRDHIECIMASIEEECPVYDPRTLVNPDASALLWGTESEKKIYRRKLRRSVQDSLESMDDF